ncbi:hypothetical protein F4802DRAFT_195416 [Xylaria palmicola]|nr:hypothetical protein F4802DRAFT_195416 [Xylaria palmicola]
MTWDRCQADASLLATCACKKNQNSEWASSQISASVKQNCYGHAADISSAQEVFAGYCGLVDGTTSFPETTDPPGKMTYYITALQEYKALASCARDAVSYHVQGQTDDLCPSGPKALASCACLRSEMTGSISSLISSSIRNWCATTAVDDISSALDVYKLYCSAAKGLTVPAGITESVSVTGFASQTGSSGAQETSKINPDMDNNTNNDTDANNNGTTTESMNTMSNTTVIAGAVVGSVVGTALIAVVAFLLYRRSKKTEAAALAPPAVEDAGKSELDNTSISPGSSASPGADMMKNRMENSSPVSAMSSPYVPPPMPELHSQAPRMPELLGHDAQSPLTPHEAYSQQLYEAPGQSRPPVVEAHGQPMSELQGMGWQSGPVPQAYEMDASDNRNYPPPHAR